jgi:rhodanese-related sulfurtransferase
VAAELKQQGFPNAKALLGGVAAWQQAGFPVITVKP